MHWAHVVTKDVRRHIAQMTPGEELNRCVDEARARFCQNLDPEHRETLAPLFDSALSEATAHGSSRPPPSEISGPPAQSGDIHRESVPSTQSGVATAVLPNEKRSVPRVIPKRLAVVALPLIVAAVLGWFVFQPTTEGAAQETLSSCLRTVLTKNRFVEESRSADVAAKVERALHQVKFTLRQQASESLESRALSQLTIRQGIEACATGHRLTMPKVEMESTVRVKSEIGTPIARARVSSARDHDRRCDTDQDGKCSLLIHLDDFKADEHDHETTELLATADGHGEVSKRVTPDEFLAGLAFELVGIRSIRIDIVEKRAVLPGAAVSLYGGRDVELRGESCHKRGCNETTNASGSATFVYSSGTFESLDVAITKGIETRRCRIEVAGEPRGEPRPRYQIDWSKLSWEPKPCEVR